MKETYVAKDKLRQEPSRIIESNVRVTLFDKLGGVKAAKAVVAEMYTLLLEDESTSPFFATPIW
jgi:hypothetical protein